MELAKLLALVIGLALAAAVAEAAVSCRRETLHSTKSKVLYPNKYTGSKTWKTLKSDSKINSMKVMTDLSKESLKVPFVTPIKSAVSRITSFASSITSRARSLVSRFSRLRKRRGASSSRSKCYYRTLSSHSYRYATSTLSNNKRFTIAVSRKYSRSRCDLNKSFGIKGNKMWVHHGCRAMFRICELPPVVPKPKPKPIPKPTIPSCIEGKTFGYENNKIWVYGNCKAEFMVCFNLMEPIDMPDCIIKELYHMKSSRKSQETATIDGPPIESMTVAVTMSTIAGANRNCQFNRDFGFDADTNFVYSKNGCINKYRICFENPVKKRVPVCGATHNLKQVCMFKDLDSWDYKYAEKHLGPAKSWSVEVDKKRSKSECKHKTSFGITGSKLWVKKGCRATFKICHYPESDDIECKNVKLYGGRPATVIDEAEVVTCITESKGLSSKCYKYGRPQYSFAEGKNLVKALPECNGEFRVCYKRKQYKDETVCPVPSRVSQSVCYDMKLDGRLSNYITDADKIDCMVLKEQKKGAKCWVNGKKAYKHEGTRFRMDRRCEGTFTVCYKPKCKLPFKNIAGKCLLVESRSLKNYIDASLKCKSIGGKLASIKEPFTFYKDQQRNHLFKGKSFFIGDSKIFEHPTKRPIEFADKPVSGIHPRFGIRPPVFFPKLPVFRPFKSLPFITRATRSLKAPVSKTIDAFRRYTGLPLERDVIKDAPLRERCLSMNFRQDGPQFVHCDTKMHFICAEAHENFPDTKWSDWFNLDEHKSNQDESLSNIVKKHQKGELENAMGSRKIPSSSLCAAPVAMQCRDVETHKIYSQYQTHGLDLQYACTKNRIKCDASRNRGKPCPDFEVRFKCPPSTDLTCKNPLMKSNCEHKNKDCKDTIFGPTCLEKPTTNNDNMVIGKQTCNFAGQELETRQCVSRGDPHLTTFDGAQIDEFRTNNGEFVFFDFKSFHFENPVPDMRVVITNSPLKNYISKEHSRSFELTINGTRYAFAGDGSFTVNDLERNYMNFEDDFVNIQVQMKGGRDENGAKVVINTDFCLQIVWDTRMSLYVRLPQFKGVKTGLCGNFDGNPNNDLVLPNARKASPQKDFTHYFMVNSENSKGCIDCADKPKPCSAYNLKRYSGAKYCGVFDPNSDSPFVKYVINNYKNDKENKNQLKQLYDDCITNFCRVPGYYNQRCFEIETHIEEAAKDLQVSHVERLDQEWRKYSGCGKTDLSTCKYKRHSHYESHYYVQCQPTCKHSKDTVPCGQLRGAGCVCDEGYYLNTNLDCVKIEDCEKQCQVELEDGESFTMEHGETVVIEACRRTLSCNNGDLSEKKTDPCHMHAKCVQLRGKQQECKCKLGYKGDGRKCEIDRSCRPGFTPMGDSCYYFNPAKLEWHDAALQCAAKGASLARYDSEVDEQLEEYLMMALPRQMGRTKTRPRKVKCALNKPCRSRYRDEYIFELRPTGSSARISMCMKSTRISRKRDSIMVTDKKCVGYYYLKALRVQDLNAAYATATWVGGNSWVLGHGKRDGLTPFNVDPPRLIDETEDNELGCYEAKFNSKNQMIVRLNPGKKHSCYAKQPSLCQYDNSVEVPKGNIYYGCYKDTGRRDLNRAGKNDFRRDNTPEKCVAFCKKRGHKYASVQYSFECFCGEKYGSYGKLAESRCDKKCSGNSKKMCGGTWANSVYGTGLEVEVRPTAYTPSFPVPVASSVRRIKDTVTKRGMTSVCDQHLEMKCMARKEGRNGPWVSNKDTNTITCNEREVSCKKNQGIRCSTLQVQFLCEQKEDQCKALSDLGATACDGGRVCSPRNNHYECRCPQDMKWSDKLKRCTGEPKVCSAWGDPHYTTFSGVKYDFMGDCKYKFSGTCDAAKEEGKPNFDIYTKNQKCGNRGAACIRSMEIILRNVRVTKNKVTKIQDFEFRFDRTQTNYMLNGDKIRQRVYHVPGAFKVDLVGRSFNLVSAELGLKVHLVGTRLTIHVDEGKHQLCGLCQEIGQPFSQFIYANGTTTSHKNLNNPNFNRMRHLRKDRSFLQFITDVADSYVVPDAYSTNEKCAARSAIPEGCTPEQDKLFTSEKYCGIFKMEESPLMDCFEVVDPEEFFEDCLFDACLEPDAMGVVCSSVAAYHQACLDKGVALGWRSESFCPFKCEANEEYRADASCESECGLDYNVRKCNDAPEEGCVCAEGYIRQGSECVKQCGCAVALEFFGLEECEDCPDSMTLPMGEWMLSNDCGENITCVFDETMDAVFEKFIMPDNSFCNQGPPTHVECYKGFTMSEDGKTCVRDKIECKQGFTEHNGMCLDNPHTEGPKRWRLAVQQCNDKDSSLPYVDSEFKLDALKDLMIKKNIKAVHIAGKVRVLEDSLKPAVVQSGASFVNYHIPEYLMKIAQVSNEITDENMPKHALSLVARLTDDKNVAVIAVPSTAVADIICQEKPNEDDDLEWTPPCNTDHVMKGNGDQELLSNMQLNQNCHVCPVPKDVRCTAVNGKSGVSGVCSLNKDGLLYSCNQGEACVDKEVSTLCTKDIDECALGLDDCGREATCVNTIGAYQCKCMNDNFPLMLDGNCVEAKTCAVAGPDGAGGHEFNVTGFHATPAVFDYDCSFILANPGGFSYTTGANMPYVEFALMRMEDTLAIVGTIFSQHSKTSKGWMINAELLKEKKFKFGHGENMLKHELNFVSKEANAKFLYKAPGVMIIHSLDNMYKVRLTMDPFSIQMDMSSELASMMSGICSLKPETLGGEIVLDQDQMEAVSVGTPKCMNKPLPPVLPPQEPDLPEPEPEPPIVPPIVEPPPVTEPIEDDPIYTPVDPTDPIVIDPILIDPVKCDEDAVHFCTILDEACGHDFETCINAVCMDSISKCDYLSKETFDACDNSENFEKMMDGLSCDYMCDANEKFHYSLPQFQRTCDNLDVMPTQGEDHDNLHEYEFGCYCAWGFVLSGGECVREEDCGCMIDGTYHKANTKFISSDCTTTITCHGRGAISAVPYKCGPNTVCAQTEDDYQCACQDGFYGNPLGFNGCVPGNTTDDGSRVCYEYVVDGLGTVEERCNCTLGFISNCNDCEDVDECKLGLHDCDLSREKCVNVRGGYECHCDEGFVDSQGECVDVNECSNMTNPCSAKSQGCVNTFGGYECTCCAGYTETEEGECVRDELGFPTMPDNAQCCHECNIPALCESCECDLTVQPFCYMFEHGEKMDFFNGRALFKYLCLNGINYEQKRSHLGECQLIPDETFPEPIIDPTDPDPVKPAPLDTITQVPEITHGIPETCDDPRLVLFLPVPAMELTQGPVCGPSSAPQTYDSYFDMVLAVCKKLGSPMKMPRSTPISAKAGKCEGEKYETGVDEHTFVNAPTAHLIDDNSVVITTTTTKAPPKPEPKPEEPKPEEPSQPEQPKPQPPKPKTTTTTTTTTRKPIITTTTTVRPPVKPTLPPAPKTTTLGPPAIPQCKTMDGVRKYHGDEWKEGDCTNCKCEFGYVSCMVMECYNQFYCAKPIKVPGKCCPECAESKTTTTTPAPQQIPDQVKVTVFTPPEQKPQEPIAVGESVYAMAVDVRIYEGLEYVQAYTDSESAEFKALEGKVQPWAEERLTNAFPSFNGVHVNTIREGSVIVQLIASFTGGAGSVTPEEVIEVLTTYVSYFTEWRVQILDPFNTPTTQTCHSEYNDMAYGEGGSWTEGDCTNCTCHNGNSLCVVQDCFTPNCNYPVKVPGQCCYECLDEPEPEFTPWTMWGECHFEITVDQELCGMGTQQRHREMLPLPEGVAPYEPKEEDYFQTRACFIPCTDENTGEVDTDNCPLENVCDHVEPVCGSPGPGPTTTYQSECILNIKACKAGKMPIKLYSGKCDPEDDMPAMKLCNRDGPVRTSVKYEFKDYMEECFGPVTDIKTCNHLLCDGGSKTCCKATSYEPIEVQVSCYSLNPREFLRFKKHVHYSATACGCEENGEN